MLASPLAKKLFAFFSLLSSPLLLADSPTLQADRVIGTDGEGEPPIAEGNVNFTYKDITIFADRLQYFEKEQKVEAFGEVKIDTPQGRIRTEKITFEYSKKDYRFQTEEALYARPPFYLQASTLQGFPDSIKLIDSKMFYQEPDALTPSIHSPTWHYQKATEDRPESLSFRAGIARIGALPLLYLPGYTLYPENRNARFHYRTQLGSSSDLGIYAKNEFLYPLSPTFKLGTSIDLYSEKGILVGPLGEYSIDQPHWQATGSFYSGYSQDRNPPETDNNGNPVDRTRGFFSWQHLQSHQDNWELRASVDYWSDSEVLKDFRRDRFLDDQEPDNFLESTYSQGNWVFNAYTQFSPNDFVNRQNRLPRLRIDGLTSPLFKTDLYHQSYLEFSHNQADYVTDSLTEEQNHRIDAYYGWLYPLSLTPNLRFTPKIGHRITHYRDTSSDQGQSYTRILGEIGFDIHTAYQATWEVENPQWGIHHLRHLLRPSLQYRYTPNADTQQDRIPIVDRLVFQNTLNPIDLENQRNTDQLIETHQLRIGLENLLQTKTPKDHTTRNWLRSHLYQDILFTKRSPQDAYHRTCHFLAFTPLPWFTAQQQLMLDTETLTLKEMQHQIDIDSGIFGNVSLQQSAYQNQVDQYGLQVQYRLDARNRIAAQIRFDGRQKKIYRQQYRWEKKISHAWLLGANIDWQENDQGEDQWNFSIKIRLL